MNYQCLGTDPFIRTHNEKSIGTMLFYMSMNIFPKILIIIKCYVCQFLYGWMQLISKWGCSHHIMTCTNSFFYYKTFSACGFYVCFNFICWFRRYAFQFMSKTFKSLKAQVSFSGYLSSVFKTVCSPSNSLPKPKAQVSFSDQNLSVVRRCRYCHCRCYRKLFTFLSSSQEPLYQYHPNLAQSIYG